MQRLLLNPTTNIARPNTQVAFDDPEIIRWRFIRGRRGTGIEEGEEIWRYFMEFEVYGEFPVLIILTTTPPLPPPLQVTDYSVITSRDAATGISFRKIKIQISNPATADDVAAIFKTNHPNLNFGLSPLEGGRYFLATDFTGGRLTVMDLPYSVYRNK
ncbi:MAG: hypothetical protein NT023_03725 [Armatimonadetes bacterium]|nr:hypothetical protein [Armatimonadota bacterium]